MWQVQVKKAVRNKDVVVPNENGNGGSHSAKGMRAPTIRRSKLLIVDLAGSERVDKSGWLWIACLSPWYYVNFS